MKRAWGKFLCWWGVHALAQGRDPKWIWMCVRCQQIQAPKLKVRR